MINLSPIGVVEDQSKMHAIRNRVVDNREIRRAADMSGSTGNAGAAGEEVVRDGYVAGRKDADL